MRYNLPILPRNDFDQYHQLVRSVFDLGRQRFAIELVNVTTDISECPTVHHAYLNSNDSLAVAMQDTGKPEEFHIWITPQYTQPLFKFYMTLAHELTHGYAGMSYGHSAHWRRWFYRVLWHLRAADLLPAPESTLGLVCFSVESCYNIASTNPDTLMTTVLEAFNRAESEHEQVMVNFFRRMQLA